jgi:pimeloyl-ACP methyl ester carboxylesterase
MSRVTVDGVSLAYETMGSGQPIVFLPGGRSSRDLMRPISRPLSKDYRCVIYDRRNCGESDIVIGGEKSEQEIWADELAGLIRALDIGPAYVGGWSAGCRVALLTAVRYPELVKGLLLGWVTGGNVAAKQLSHTYYGQFIEAAEKGGMRAVAATPFFAERILANSANKQLLLAMDAAEFISVMRRWGDDFAAGGDLPVIGATEEELAAVQTPAVIAAGDDDVHPTTAAQNLHRLLRNSELHGPLIPRYEWDTLSNSPETRDEVRAQRCLPIFQAFLAKNEAVVRA